MSLNYEPASEPLLLHQSDVSVEEVADLFFFFITLQPRIE